MNRPTDTGSSRLARHARASALCLIGLSLLLWSCATPSPESASTASPEDASADSPRKAPPKRKKAPAPPKRVVMTPEMDEKLAGLLFALLEREAQIQHLQKTLDEAIQETVRSKAKLTSQESRAEAAANLAEAEVALKTLKTSFKGLDKDPDYAHVAQLIAASAEELKKENYGGSLYLTNQVKALIRELQDRMESEQQEKSTAASAGGAAASSEFDTKYARLQALLAERDAQVQTLNRKIDDSIHEAVRTKSKLRSQDSKAEAASDLAEGEGALKAFKGSIPEVEQQPDFARATVLVTMSAAELKKENYSGSLYLTAQAKAILKDLKEKSKEREDLSRLDGETLFAQPLPIKIAVSGKARKEPAPEAAVAWSVERGASLVALSHKGPWLRVEGDGDRRGWVFYSLIAGP